MMSAISFELETVINKWLPMLRDVPEAEMTFKPSATRWSKKEMVGHMTDSAQNNIRRFIVAQYENEPKIIYNQDEWVRLAAYQQYDLPDLINLWWSLNNHICNILKMMPDEISMRRCETGAMHTIEWLAHDYLKHLRHHMHQVLDLEPVIYP